MTGSRARADQSAAMCSRRRRGAGFVVAGGPGLKGENPVPRRFGCVLLSNMVGVSVGVCLKGQRSVELYDVAGPGFESHVDRSEKELMMKKIRKGTLEYWSGEGFVVAPAHAVATDKLHVGYVNVDAVPCWNRDVESYALVMATICFCQTSFRGIDGVRKWESEMPYNETTAVAEMRGTMAR
jgi:hypothetical protein